MGLLKVFFYFVLTVVVFNMIRLVLMVKKALMGSRRNFTSKKPGSTEDNSAKHGNKNSVIELDKDQYHVE